MDERAGDEKSNTAPLLTLSSRKTTPDIPWTCIDVLVFTRVRIGCPVGLTSRKKDLYVGVNIDDDFGCSSRRRLGPRVSASWGIVVCMLGSRIYMKGDRNGALLFGSRS